MWLGGTPSARAAGEPCTRDTECAGSETCVDEACEQGAELPACTSDDDCEVGEACIDAHCKIEGVVCRSVAGACWVRESSGECHCGDGNEAGWSDGYNPDAPPEEPTEADLADRCVEELADTCGTEPPSLPDSCTGDVLTECETYVAHVDALSRSCGEDVPEVNLARVGDCCEAFEVEGMAQYRACLLDIELGDSCPGDAWEACEGAGFPESAGAGQDAESGGDEASESSGCRVGAPSSGLASTSLLGWILLRRRRRRS